MKPIERKLRLKQSVCRWCYSKIPVEDFAKECARLNVQSVDLADPKEWPVYKKFGLVPTMIGGGTTISDGFNRKENREGVAAQLPQPRPGAALKWRSEHYRLLRQPPRDVRRRRP